jgi:hypothetical protein
LKPKNREKFISKNLKVETWTFLTFLTDIRTLKKTFFGDKIISQQLKKLSEKFSRIVFV